MALIYDHTFAAYSSLSSLPAQTDVGYFTGYSGAQVTSIVVKIRKGLVAGTRLVKAGVYTDEVGTLSYSGVETVSFTGLESKEVTLTFSSPPTAHIWAGGYIRVYLEAAAGTGSTATWWYDGDNWLQVNGTLIAEEPEGIVKPSTPTPADASGPGINFSTWAISWVDGGTTETYDVFMGTSPYTLNRVVEGTALTSHTFALGQRPAITGGVVYWRVDAIVGEDRATGDTWSFDPRPAKVGTPDPADSATTVSVNLVALDWAAAAQADTYDVFFGTVLGTAYAGLSATTSGVPSAPLDWNEMYLWRVDSENEFGTTTGDEWSFSTLSLDPPACSYTLLPGGSSSGPFADPPGTEGTDWVWNGTNNMRTTRKLVALADNRVWYEEVS